MLPLPARTQRATTHDASESSSCASSSPLLAAASAPRVLGLAASCCSSANMAVLRFPAVKRGPYTRGTGAPTGKTAAALTAGASALPVAGACRAGSSAVRIERPMTPDMHRAPEKSRLTFRMSNVTYDSAILLPTTHRKFCQLQCYDLRGMNSLATQCVGCSSVFLTSYAANGHRATCPALRQAARYTDSAHEAQARKRLRTADSVAAAEPLRDDSAEDAWLPALDAAEPDSEHDFAEEGSEPCEAAGAALDWNDADSENEDDESILIDDLVLDDAATELVLQVPGIHTDTVAAKAAAAAQHEDDLAAAARVRTSLSESARLFRVGLMLGQWAHCSGRALSHAQFDSLIALLQQLSAGGFLTPDAIARLMPLRRVNEMALAMSQQTHMALPPVMAFRVPVAVKGAPAVTYKHLAFGLRDVLVGMLTDVRLTGATLHWDPAARTAAFNPARPHGDLWNARHCVYVMTAEVAGLRRSSAFTAAAAAAREQGRTLEPLPLGIVMCQDDTAVGQGRGNAAPLLITLANWGPDVADTVATVEALAMLERMEVPKGAPTDHPSRLIARRVYHTGLRRALAEPLAAWGGEAPLLIDGEILACSPAGLTAAQLTKTRFFADPFVLLPLGDYNGRQESLGMSTAACACCICNYDDRTFADVDGVSLPRNLHLARAAFLRMEEALNTPPEHRTAAQSASMREDAANLTAGGYRLGCPWWVYLPSNRGCMRLPNALADASPGDPLHTATMGVMGHIEKEWLTDLVSDSAPSRSDGARRIRLLDARVAAIPPCTFGPFRRRGFPKGWSGLKLPTGDDLRDGVPVLFASLGRRGDRSIVDDDNLRDSVACVLETGHWLNNFLRYDDFSEEELIRFANGQREFLRNSDKTFEGYSEMNFPKHHLPEHFADDIRNWGRPRNFDLQKFESALRTLVKDPARATNFKDWVRQVLVGLRRRRFFSRALPPLLGMSSPFVAALLPLPEDVTYLRGRVSSLAVAATQPSCVPAAVLQQAPAAWRRAMEARFGGAFAGVDAQLAWVPGNALRYRTIRMRVRTLRVDGTLHDDTERRCAILFRGAADGGAAAPQDAFTIKSGVPQFFFRWTGSMPAHQGEPGIVVDDDVDGDAAAADPMPGSATTVDSSNCFVAYYALAPTSRDSLLARSSALRLTAPRLVDTSKLHIVPIACVLRPLRALPLYRPLGDDTDSDILRTEGVYISTVMPT